MKTTFLISFSLPGLWLIGSLAGLGAISCGKLIEVTTTATLVPEAPLNVTGAAGDASVLVTWTPPPSDGGSAITVYAVAALEDSTKGCSSSSGLACTVEGLTNGESYRFVVRASNAVGTGPSSLPSAAVTPYLEVVPGKPINLAALPLEGSVTLYWEAPESNGAPPVTSYKVSVSQDTGLYCKTSTALSCTINGIWDDLEYTFRVTAFNRVGAGQASDTLTIGRGGGALGSNWTPRTSGTNVDLHDVVWTGTKLVAVGVNGVSVISSDGLTWASNGMGTTAVFRGIAWTGSQFVAVGDNGVIRTSPDGIVWTARTSGTQQHLYDVAWIGKQIVVVGLNGEVGTSLDGVVWTFHNSGSAFTLLDVAGTANLMIAVGVNGNIRASSNGIDWTMQDAQTFTPLYGIAFHGGRFMAVGGGGNLIFSDGDAIWKSIPSGTTQHLYSVAPIDNRGFIYVGDRGTIGIATGEGGEVRTSGTTRFLTAGVSTGRRLVVVGAAGTILTSP